MIKDSFPGLTLQIFLYTAIIFTAVPGHGRERDGGSLHASRESYEDYAHKRYRYINAEYRNEEHEKKAVKSPNKTVQSKNSIEYKKYRVKKGDTLYSIARRHGMSPADLQKANNLRSAGSLMAGSILRIPSRRNSGEHSASCDPAKKTATAPLKSSSPPFCWPLNHVVSYNRDGIDGVKSIGLVIVGKYGAPVLSSAAGTVKKIGYMRGYGRYIVVKHRNSFITVYANLQDISVREGDHIASGRVLGRVDGDTRKLHFQIDHDGKPTDPLRYLPRKAG